MRYQLIILGLSLCMMISTTVTPVARAADTSDVSGTAWVSRDKKGSVTRLMEFHKNGTFVDMTDQYIYVGMWIRKDANIVAAVKYQSFSTEDGTQGVEYITYLPKVVDGKLRGVSFHENDLERRRFWERSFDLEQETTTCAGERGICKGRLYCIDPATRKSAERMPILETRVSRPEQSGEPFEDFLGAFVCAARLNMSGNLATRVRFPLAVTEIDDAQPSNQESNSLGKRNTRKAVSSSDFPKIKLWPAEREKDRPAVQRQIFNSEPMRDNLGVHQNLVPPFSSRPGRSVLSPWLGGNTLWHFTQENGAWYLDEVWECRSNACPEALYCGEGYPKNSFPGAASGKGEDFYEFFHVFYCAMYAGNEDLVFSRIKYPLPYEVFTTEGEQRGKFKGPEKSLSIELYACDGYPLPPALSVNGDKAEASLPRDGTGCGKELSFKRISGQWYLVHARFNSY